MADPSFHIATPRLFLHYFLSTDPTHVDFLIKCFNAPDVFGLTSTLAGIKSSRDAAVKDIEGRIELQTKSGFGRYMISLRKDANQPFSASEDYEHIGIVSMKLRRHPKAPKVPDIGYILLGQYWGKGYATEAGAGVIDYFATRGVTDILGFCNLENEASRKTLKRLGFEEREMRCVYGLGDRMDDVAEEELVWARKGMSADLSIYGL
jgi:RimJ/RimL family protein N-acetyltransferase